MEQIDVKNKYRVTIVNQGEQLSVLNLRNQKVVKTITLQRQAHHLKRVINEQVVEYAFDPLEGELHQVNIMTGELIAS